MKSKVEVKVVKGEPTKNIVKTRKKAGSNHVVKSKSTGTSLLTFEVIGLCFIFIGVFATVGIMGIDTGTIGYGVDEILAYGFGFTRIVVSLSLIIIGLKYIIVRRKFPLTRSWGICMWIYLLVQSLIHLVFIPQEITFLPTSIRIGGGIFGAAIAAGLRSLFGEICAIIMIVIVFIGTLVLWKRWSLARPLQKASHQASIKFTHISDKTTNGVQDVARSFQEWRDRRERFLEGQKEIQKLTSAALATNEKDLQVDEIHNNELTAKDMSKNIVDINTYQEKIDMEESALQEEKKVLQDAPVSEKKEKPIASSSIFTEERLGDISVVNQTAGDDTAIALNEMEALKPVEIEPMTTSVEIGNTETSAVPKAVVHEPYQLPSIEILKPGTGTIGGVSAEVKENAAILQSTLQSFNIDARILHASQGPAVTRFELEPAAGVKVSKIVHLADDIALKLAATDIRIEAPIPGKAAVGIEVPNKSVSSVTLRDILESDSFRLAKGGVPVSLGKDIAGNPIIADLTKMPHLLVAGSTGSGKSVCINTFIASILFKQRPEDVKLVLVDPKVVELSNYNGIPHLMTPVVTDPKKAASVLRWAVREMDDRYKRFAYTKTRDISRFNELHPEEAMPFIVIIIDELADLMMAASGDVEESICRLAQKARACGMHLVLATQRPSVDVLTGLIKANVPSRIAFAVSSQIDSRTILDMAGAEKLIGKGDMLFYPMGASKPIRVQGAFISDTEIDEVVEFIKQQRKPHYDEEVEAAQQEDKEMGDFFEDDLMEQAINMVLETGQASASMLQRRFRIGYTRAARLIDMMEAMHIVGANNGSKPREILMTEEEIQEKFGF